MKVSKFRGERFVAPASQNVSHALRIRMLHRKYANRRFNAEIYASPVPAGSSRSKRAAFVTHIAVNLALPSATFRQYGKSPW